MHHSIIYDIFLYTILFTIYFLNLCETLKLPEHLSILEHLYKYCCRNKAFRKFKCRRMSVIAIRDNNNNWYGRLSRKASITVMRVRKRYHKYDGIFIVTLKESPLTLHGKLFYVTVYQHSLNTHANSISRSLDDSILA